MRWWEWCMGRCCGVCGDGEGLVGIWGCSSAVIDVNDEDGVEGAY